jgi:hypothetical protein
MAAGARSRAAIMGVVPAQLIGWIVKKDKVYRFILPIIIPIYMGNAISVIIMAGVAGIGFGNYMPVVASLRIGNGIKNGIGITVAIRTRKL